MQTEVRMILDADRKSENATNHFLMLAEIRMT